MFKDLTFLIADDEELMRETMEMVILENGGKSFLAENGEKAVEIYTKNKDLIDISLVDFSMPLLDGSQVAETILSINEAARIIVFSGLNPSKKVAELCKANRVKFLSKPFRAKDLLERIDSFDL